MNHEFNPATYFEDIGAWPRNSHGIRTTYVIGFLLSIILTFIAYFLASAALLPQHALLICLGVLALVQFAVQIVCFFHLGREAAARDRLIVLGFASVIVFILVAGSLWIMISLDGRMMPSTTQMEKFVHSEDAF